MANYRGKAPLPVCVDTIRDLVNMKFSVPKIAKHIGVSIATVRRRMREAGIKIKETYTSLNDDDLDNLVASMVLQYPNLGRKLMKGMLWSEHKVRLPENRLRACMKRVDPIGVSNRRQTNRAIYRRSYSVPHSNYLWHVDTYLKLNRYNIVIRSGIDGKSRLCVYLEADTNNRAVTSLVSFLRGVQRYGTPLHCRTDKGSECVLIARFMITARGPNGHFTGKSVRNQRIERYWGDVKRVTSHFSETMHELEDDGILDIDDELHMKILHYVFVPRLNDALEKFRQGWNDHPLSSEHDNTPNQLFVINKIGEFEDINMEEVESIQREVMEYAPAAEPADNVRYLQDAVLTLSDNQLQRLSNIDVLQQSVNNGKDLYVQCLQAAQVHI